MAEHLIHILPEQVASQIAAGEVVERPASAVKELVENALDAEASSVTVEISGGGGALIAVSDDGCGMSSHDAVLSVRRHATSKIHDVGDLNAIRTLGFRGEALASIASVSRLELKTRRRDDLSGMHMSLVGGDIVDKRELPMAPGTRIEVFNLFFNTPARLKFLKSVPTEQGAIVEVLQRLALANSAVAFALSADGRALLELPKAQSLMERARQLFGAKLAEQMLPFKAEDRGLKVHGLASASQASYPTARMILAFVNHRSIRDRLLARAISQAYATLVPRGRYPAVALFLELRPEDVDVNVHPMKTEVRFRRSKEVFELVYHALRDRLADQTAASKPVGSAPPGLSEIGDRAEPGVRSFEQPPAVARDRRLSLVSDSSDQPSQVEQRALGLGYNRAATPFNPTASIDLSRGGAESLAPKTGSTGANSLPDRLPATPAKVPVYSQLRLIGQLFAGYIALESDDGLLLVDQHAAHERVTFEKLRAELRNGGVRIQSRLVPEPVELNPAQAARLEPALSRLRALGFDVELFGPATLILKGTPAVFGPAAGGKLLSDMIDTMAEGEWARHGEEAFDDLLKELACHGSVRVGRMLQTAEIHALLADLDRTEFKTNCPHGRPVHISFPRGQIERMFRR